MRKAVLFSAYSPAYVRNVEDVREILMRLRDEGKTIILSSHNKENIEILCDEVYEMDHGILDVYRLMKS